MRPLLAGILSVALGAGPSFAVSVGLPGVDVTGVVTTATITFDPASGSEFSIPKTGTTDVALLNFNSPATLEKYTGKAQQDADSFSTIEYDGTWADETFKGSVVQYRAQTFYGFSVTNTAPARSLSYTFSLTGMEIELYGGTPVISSNPFEGGGNVGVRLEHEFETQGPSAPTTLSKLGYDFWGFTNADRENLQGSEKEAGLEGTISDILVPSGNEQIKVGVRSLINNKSVTVDLGAFDEGETKTFSATMSMSVKHGFIEDSIFARISDPGGLTGRFTVTGPVAAVPVPAAAWLLLAGLGALTVLRRARRRASA